MNNFKEKIAQLKAEKNAVILAHYYVEPQVQEIADFVGDSYYLAKIAKSTDAEVIVFCGVEFMGESAKILNPEKTVLMPDASADCPMAHMATTEEVLKIKNKYEDTAVVCYINSSARLKTVSDVCVTSANALKIVNALPNKNIYFIPDRNLGTFVKKNTDKNIILNEGWCPIHNSIKTEDIKAFKELHKDVKVLMHPECTDDVLKLADYIGSTSGIIDYATSSEDTEFIIVTETGVLYELQEKNPNKKFYFPEPLPVCADMKKITLEKVLNCLESNLNEVIIDDKTREKAMLPLNRMLELAR
ncbi:MAG: quinolinate synthase NadA [Eubacterium sp.]|jgi:quinolinate synthase|nr:quinolinate synthase NadA [Eubacterium sp.]